jgi:hypothetical protein
MENSTSWPAVFVALPMTDENDFLPQLLDCFDRQDYRNFRVFICINQPDEWWHVPGKKQICERNVAMLDHLKETDLPYITLIDRCSTGKGWKGKRHGVGWARKTVMDAIDREADAKDIIVSMDADTYFREGYLGSVAGNFTSNPEAVAMAVPYFHRPPADPEAYRAILRYEIYMRHYTIQMWRIGSPYSFAALGSAMACPVRAYRAVGGMTPKMSGEDFYFLQKLRKYGRMIFHNREKVFPAARFSSRVYFGTGPAMIRGREGDWSSYPIYPYLLFDEVRETYGLFPSFFERTENTRVVDFLKKQSGETDPFRLLRENFRTPEGFVRACHEKLDGLRILQYLKYRHHERLQTDEKSLVEFFDRYAPRQTDKDPGIDWSGFSFAGSSLDDLERVRGWLMIEEEECQRAKPVG